MPCFDDERVCGWVYRIFVAGRGDWTRIQLLPVLTMRYLVGRAHCTMDAQDTLSLRGEVRFSLCLRLLSYHPRRPNAMQLMEQSPVGCGPNRICSTFLRFTAELGCTMERLVSSQVRYLTGRRTEVASAGSIAQTFLKHRTEGAVVGVAVEPKGGRRSMRSYS